MDAQELAARVRGIIADHGSQMTAMRADKPNVIDGHSDGKRVRYVRHEERIATLRDVLALLDGATPATPDAR